MAFTLLGEAVRMVFFIFVSALTFIIFIMTVCCFPLEPQEDERLVCMGIESTELLTSEGAPPVGEPTVPSTELHKKTQIEDV